MGGTMNLNPLKKETNTDALVQALADANQDTSGAVPSSVPAPDTTTVAAVPPAPSNEPAVVAEPVQAPIASAPAPAPVGIDDSMIADDPQIAEQSNPLLSPDPVPTPIPTPAEPVAPDPIAQPTDVTAGVSFDDNSLVLPGGMSSDADAHLPDPATTEVPGELDDVKKEALEDLRPLIEKLDLEPADKFDKYLMMLRASDDSTLIKPAYEAAKNISGEKEKAQALLDVINEINYITASKQ